MYMKIGQTSTVIGRKKVLDRQKPLSLEVTLLELPMLWLLARNKRRESFKGTNLIYNHEITKRKINRRLC